MGIYPQGEGWTSKQIIFERHLLETCWSIFGLFGFDLCYMLSEKWKESSFPVGIPNFHVQLLLCQRCCYSRFILVGGHWQRSSPRVKLMYRFLWIGAYVKLIDNSFGINNAVDILNNSPKIKLQWFHQKKLTMIGEQRQFASNSRPISRISGPLYNQPRFDWAFKEFVSCSAGEDEPLFTCHVCDGISSNEVQVDYALPNGFKWQVYCTDYYSMMVSLVANSLSQIHDGFTTLQNGRNCQYIAHLYGVSVPSIPLPI